MKRILTILLLAFTTGAAFAQQEAEYTMYRFNSLYINPAYAGSREVLSAMAIYRHQWVNVPGAPRSASASVHSPLRNNRLALGLIYSYDRHGITQTHDVNGMFAYRLPVGKRKKVKICFGVSAGVRNYSADLGSVNTNAPDDPNFTGSTSLWMPQIGAGIYAYGERFFVGVSVPNLLANSLSSNKVWENDGVARRYHHLYGTAGYVFSIGKKVKFMPSVLVKYVPKYAPVTADFNATFIFIDRIWLGAGYRLNDSYSFMGAVNITKQLRVGYAYDLTVSPLSKFTTGTHEVMLGFDFDFNKNRFANPRYIKYF